MSISQEEINILASLGLPLSDDHSAGAVDFKIAAEILRKISLTESEGRLRDTARAWLIAVYDHYPDLYAKHFATPELLTLASGPRTGRDIKLRRLALSHLGKIASHEHHAGNNVKIRKISRGAPVRFLGHYWRLGSAITQHFLCQSRI